MLSVPDPDRGEARPFLSCVSVSVSPARSVSGVAFSSHVEQPSLDSAYTSLYMVATGKSRCLSLWVLASAPRPAPEVSQHEVARSARAPSSRSAQTPTRRSPTTWQEESFGGPGGAGRRAASSRAKWPLLLMAAAAISLGVARRRSARLVRQAPTPADSDMALSVTSRSMSAAACNRSRVRVPQRP